VVGSALVAEMKRLPRSKQLLGTPTSGPCSKRLPQASPVARPPIFASPRLSRCEPAAICHLTASDESPKDLNVGVILEFSTPGSKSEGKQ